jgi:hypothetical protein
MKKEVRISTDILVTFVTDLIGPSEGGRKQRGRNETKAGTLRQRKFGKLGSGRPSEHSKEAAMQVAGKTGRKCWE